LFSRVLELGAGTGRITHRLLELGYSVTAIDNSAEMLAEIRGATTVLSDIEDLALSASFDAVVLGSFLIHAPALGTRATLLEVCRRHVKRSGVVLVQHYRDGWPARAEPGFLGEKDGIKTFVDDVAHDGRFVRITLRYEAASGTWTQSFTTEALNQSELADALGKAGLSFDRHLGQDSSWLLARPTSGEQRRRRLRLHETAP
jgi:SAM-dependent methyltransferase